LPNRLPDFALWSKTKKTSEEVSTRHLNGGPSRIRTVDALIKRFNLRISPHIMGCNAVVLSWGFTDS
jgi:hypothetical protein